jgi:hypothetical protein
MRTRCQNLGAGTGPDRLGEHGVTRDHVQIGLAQAGSEQTRRGHIERTRRSIGNRLIQGRGPHMGADELDPLHLGSFEARPRTRHSLPTGFGQADIIETGTEQIDPVNAAPWAPERCIEAS